MLRATLLRQYGLRNEAIIYALQTLVGKPLAETKVLFVTTAANTGYDDKRWLLHNLLEFDRAGVLAIDVIDFAGLPEDLIESHVAVADVICVGGGDERYLARMFAAHDFAQKLPLWLASKVYMGISAGSMVLGHYLAVDVSKAIFIEEDFGDMKGDGLGLLSFAYIPHLNSSFFSLRKERLDSLQDKFNVPVYATDDETALMVVNGEVTKVGDGALHYYDQSI